MAQSVTALFITGLSVPDPGTMLIVCAFAVVLYLLEQSYQELSDRDED